MKLSGNLGQYDKEGWDQEQNQNTLLLAMCKNIR